MPIAPFARRRRYPIIEGDTATYAADFEADDTEFLSIVDNASLSLGADSAATVLIWFNPESLAGTQLLISKSTNAVAANAEWPMIYTSANKFSTYIGNGAGGGAGATATTFGAISTGTWYMVAAAHDPVGNTIGISVNGGAYDTGAWAGGTFDGAGTFEVAARIGAQLSDGAAALLGLWKDRVVLAAELSAIFAKGPTLLYTGLTAAQKTNLVAWWDFEEESGARVDSHGSNDLTDNNTVGRALVVYP